MEQWLWLENGAPYRTPSARQSQRIFLHTLPLSPSIPPGTSAPGLLRGSQFWCILMTCPSHHNWWWIMAASILLQPVFLRILVWGTRSRQLIPECSEISEYEPAWTIVCNPLGEESGDAGSLIDGGTGYCFKWHGAWVSKMQLMLTEFCFALGCLCCCLH